MRPTSEVWLDASFTADAGWASRVRRDTGAALEGRLDADTTRLEASLVTSELTTNAMLHAGGPVRLEVGRTDWELVIAVTDSAPALRPEPRIADDRGTAGHGLRIVAGIAARWGVDYGETTKTVWFTVPLPTDGD